MTPTPDRRQLLRAGGVALLGSLAGCSDLLGGSVSFDENVPDEVADHLENANNVDGSITDRTGESSVTIEVGPGGNLAYDPALASIDAGTTVTWDWKTMGHTVTSESTPGDTQFDADGDKHTETFDQPGNVLYFCEPHRGQGHLGALIVK
ncbi:halocyanin domain-containing protein [Halovenus sp. WSH3]|uniref:Halocyanin domain-containing protein n=1 Tax=Halovenus carboxidivorans TaxID=2692199 RepID=A0A6B0T870_9EURY|nr:plastocyanin/azurin family copper-binding protein [Halovenus carboxidivorans]MXR51502.1 halocyanin domain-containing protein [Halovenus carboxidivorans]